MIKLIIDTLIIIVVGCLTLAIADMHQWHSVWWAAAVDIAIAVFLSTVWGLRALNKSESDAIRDIFWKRYVAGGSIIWLYAYKVCGGKK